MRKIWSFTEILLSYVRWLLTGLQPISIVIRKVNPRPILVLLRNSFIDGLNLR
ncbi:hypothetical protein PanWU01x14_133580 [Parasponia andersonii]|uniref:Uncharacterized protein n=1 Tax=Parasponia andersonii TaxID=3476 RepID=A0A2P5CQ04_PARAD|nr:hypothetical protein PanWU01x14_133580 [Parasponia andersonii]